MDATPAGNHASILTLQPFVARRRVRLWTLAVLGVALLLAVRSRTATGQLAPPVTLGVFFAALVCEYVDSALGMGYGTTLTPLLLLAGFEPLQVVPAILLSECLTGLAAAACHHRDGNVDLLKDRQVRRTVLLLTSLSAAGAIVAALVALQIPKFWLKAAIGVIVTSVGVWIVLTRRRQLTYRWGHIIGLGALAAFNKSLSGGGYGPLVTGGQVVSGVSVKQAVAVTSLAESVTCLVGLSTYLLMAGGLEAHLVISMTSGALLSVPMATLTIRALPDAMVRSTVGVVTCALGALTLVQLVW